jgi:type VI secretion system protein ImpB
MARDDQIQAPKERVNITYRPATGDQQEQTELPFKILMVGDYDGRPDDTPLFERDPKRAVVDVDQDNFDAVMASRKLSAQISVPDRIGGEKGATLSFDLKFSSLRDFTPEGLIDQLPADHQLKQLLEIRKALTALKGPLGNKREFVAKITKLLDDDAAKQAIMAELGMKG